MVATLNVLTTNFGEFRAPEWVNDVDGDASTPQGAALWRWFDACDTRLARLFETGADIDPDMFINDPRPF